MRGRRGPLLAAAAVAAAVIAAVALPGGARLGPARADSPPVTAPTSGPIPSLGPQPAYVPPDLQNGASDTVSRMAHLKRWN